MNLSKSVNVKLQNWSARRKFTHFKHWNKLKIFVLFLPFFCLHHNLLPWAESVIEFENYTGSFFSSIFNSWSGYATFYQSSVGLIDLNFRNFFSNFFLFNISNSLIMAYVVSESFLQFNNKLRLNKLSTVILNFLIYLFFLDFVSHPSIWSATTIAYLFIVPLLLQFLLRENISIIAVVLFFIGLLSKFHPVFLLFSGILLIIGRKILFFLAVSIILGQYYLLAKNGTNIENGNLGELLNSVFKIVENGNRIILGVPPFASLLFACLGIGFLILHSLESFREKSFLVLVFYALVFIATVVVFSYLSFVNTPGVTLDVLFSTPIKAQYFIYICFLSLMCILLITWKIHDFMKSKLFINIFLFAGCIFFSLLTWSNYQLHSSITTQGVKLSPDCYLYPPTPDWSTQYSNSLDSIWSDCSVALLYNRFDGSYFTELSLSSFSSLKPRLLYVTTEAFPEIVDVKELDSCFIFKDLVNSNEIGFYLGDNLGPTFNGKFTVFDLSQKNQIKDLCKIIELTRYSQVNLIFSQ
jgi:hypothetical protein